LARLLKDTAISRTGFWKKISGNIERFAPDKIYKTTTNIMQEIIQEQHTSNDKYI